MNEKWRGGLETVSLLWEGFGGGLELLNYIEGGFPDITSTNVNGENKMLETR